MRIGIYEPGGGGSRLAEGLQGSYVEALTRFGRAVLQGSIERLMIVSD